MKVVVADSHIEFVYNASARWELCVIDDLWFHAKLFFERYVDPSAEASKLEWKKAYRGGPNVESFLAISFLPLYCESLEGLRRLTMCGFPTDKESEMLIRRLAGEPFGAFLIDPWDYTRDEFLGDDLVVPMLQRERVPFGRIAYFSFGARAAHRMEYFLKEDIVEDGERQLKDWWERTAHGAIATALFEHPLFFEPEECNLSRLSDEDFLRFIRDDFAPTEKWRVWEWVSLVLDSDHDWTSKSLVYRRGVEFLRGLDRGRGGQSVCAIEALEGLVGGLGIYSHPLRGAMRSALGPTIPPAIVEEEGRRGVIPLDQGLYSLAVALRDACDLSRVRIATAGLRREGEMLALEARIEGGDLGPWRDLEQRRIVEMRLRGRVLGAHMTEAAAEVCARVRLLLPDEHGGEDRQ